MKTLTTSMSTLRKLIAGLTLSVAFFMAGTATAQEVKFVDNTAVHTQITDQFKIALYPFENAPSINVHIENPDREKVKVLIKNSQDEVVYQKTVGNSAVIYSKFDVSHMEKGTYTMVIESASQSYANAFSIGNHQQRIAKAF